MSTVRMILLAISLLLPGLSWADLAGLTLGASNTLGILDAGPPEPLDGVGLALVRVRHYQGELKLKGPDDRLVVHAEKVRKVYLNKRGYHGPAPRLQVIDSRGNEVLDSRISGKYSGVKSWGEVTVIVFCPELKKGKESHCYVHIESN